jgi:hypothetical protein
LHYTHKTLKLCLCILSPTCVAKVASAAPHAHPASGRPPASLNWYALQAAADAQEAHTLHPTWAKPLYRQESLLAAAATAVPLTSITRAATAALFLLPLPLLLLLPSCLRPANSPHCCLSTCCLELQAGPGQVGAGTVGGGCYSLPTRGGADTQRLRGSLRLQPTAGQDCGAGRKGRQPGGIRRHSAGGGGGECGIRRVDWVAAVHEGCVLYAHFAWSHLLCLPLCSLPPCLPARLPACPTHAPPLVSRTIHTC